MAKTKERDGTAQAQKPKPYGSLGEVWGQIWDKACRVCDLLVGWWWGNRAGAPGVLCSAWSYILHLVVGGQAGRGGGGGGKVSLFLQKNSKMLLHIFLLEGPAPFPMLSYCLLTASPLFRHSLTFLISNCLNLPIDREGLESWSLVPTNRKHRNWKGFVPGRSPQGSCSVLEPNSDKVYIRSLMCIRKIESLMKAMF